MGNQKKSFDKLLEEYVFGAATEFIDQADSETQAKIIALLNQISKNTTSASKPTSGASKKWAVVLPAEYHGVQLERQWTEALEPSVRERRVKNEIYELTRRVVNLYQIRIEATVLCIGQLQQLLERSENRISDADRKSCIISHYQTIIDNKTAYLTKLQALHQQELSRVWVCY